MNDVAEQSSPSPYEADSRSTIIYFELALAFYAVLAILVVLGYCIYKRCQRTSSKVFDISKVDIEVDQPRMIAEAYLRSLDSDSFTPSSSSASNTHRHL